jgi:PPOX class probable F420-dependent enzyme
MKDGSPQVTPVWVDYDGEYVLINTAEGRQKPRNLARDNRVALSVIDQENPYKYIQVRGSVVESTSEGARDHIEMLCRKYRGPDAKYPFREGEVRVMYKIAPEHVEGRL